MRLLLLQFIISFKVFQNLLGLQILLIYKACLLEIFESLNLKSLLQPRSLIYFTSPLAKLTVDYLVDNFVLDVIIFPLVIAVVAICIIDISFFKLLLGIII